MRRAVYKTNGEENSRQEQQKEEALGLQHE
jgi:hypothetical protein